MSSLAKAESTHDFLVTLVLPCFNEEEAIDKGARSAGARVVRETAKGYGNALRRGFLEAYGRYVIMADGDGTYPVEQIAPFVERLNKGCDVVYGDRFSGSIDRGAMPWTHRYIGTP